MTGSFLASSSLGDTVLSTKQWEILFSLQRNRKGTLKFAKKKFLAFEVLF